MKQKKFVSLLLVMALSFSLFTGCGNADSQSATQSPVSSSAETTPSADGTEQESKTDENQVAAEQLLTDLKGTYEELWPVILADEYRQLWLDDSAKLVGAENAEAAVEKMSSMVTGTLTGEDAVTAYQNGNMAYCCEFLQNVTSFTFDGTTISGAASDGTEVFRHSYHYVGMEEIRGLYVYESDDADSGEFTFFCLAPDTMATTQHIEFRYGSSLDALGQYDAGEYAYWLPASPSITRRRTLKSVLIFSVQKICPNNKLIDRQGSMFLISAGYSGGYRYE